MRNLLLAATLVVLVGIQFFRPAPNLTPPGPEDAIAVYQPSPEVAAILRNSCYDCHSNQTRYPWYANVQPVGWFLASHIEEAKESVNFSHFGSLPKAKAARILEHCIDEVDEGAMPIDSYLWIHKDARLDENQRKAFAAWAQVVIDTLKPASSAK